MGVAMLGTGYSGGAFSLLPVVGIGGAAVPAVSASTGPEATCAVLADGTADCWGLFWTYLWHWHPGSGVRPDAGRQPVQGSACERRRRPLLRRPRRRRAHLLGIQPPRPVRQRDEHQQLRAGRHPRRGRDDRRATNRRRPEPRLRSAPQRHREMLGLQCVRPARKQHHHGQLDSGHGERPHQRGRGRRGGPVELRGPR